MAALFAVSCTTEGKPLLIGDDQPNPPSFTTVPEAGADAEAGLVSYCPSSECPPGWTTCPDSRFPCDTNILADANNCGGCGLACPEGDGFSSFTCNKGACALQCNTTHNRKDCDGNLDNGCESGALDPNNCGGCGKVCPTGVLCKWQDSARQEEGCGCPEGKVDCGGCKALDADDLNCGACRKRCDPTGGPAAVQYTNAYYGCLQSQCGQSKCRPYFSDCDGERENGCETSTLTNDNCGGCGNKCPAGQQCTLDSNGVAQCMCDSGLTFCQTGQQNGVPVGYCVDVSKNAGNCGACGVNCSAGGGGTGMRHVCDYGQCAFRCLDGLANCNGSEVDGCEVDTKSDPRNCGGCGIVCDGAAGQACVAGTCVVVPCDQLDAGEVTR